MVAVAPVTGYGGRNVGPSKVHGEALGAENVKATKKNLGWPEDKSFYVPEEARANWGTIKLRGKDAHAAWDDEFAEYKKAYPEPAAEFDRVIKAKIFEGWEDKITTF